jgi:hypothetical protein
MTATLDTTSTQNSPSTEWRNPKDFMSPEQWDRLVTLLVRDWPYDRVMAHRLLGQAVAYLITAMEKYGEKLEIGCGYVVDIAVHTIILDTKFYREFCDKHFGRFLDHIPEIDRKADGSVERTAKIIAANGFKVDWPLWEADYAKCTPCSQGSNCH